MMNQAEMLHFVEYELQIVALSWMAILYSIKAYQLSRLPMPWEKGQKRGNPNSGIRHSYTSIFMPWTMESSKKHLWRWLEFGLYHVAAFIAILDTFTLTFTPQLMTEPVRILFALLIAPAIPIGFVKLIKRIVKPELRVISTPDDYISLLSLQIFFFSAVMVLLVNSNFWRMSYFIVTAIFLFYVPFSKISHYIYYFFAHYLTGNRYGWRGVLPQERRVK
jgi:nitrate reductase gamma subunit